MLKEMLKVAKQLGLTEVRIDCDKENAASRNTILACGGVFDKESCENLHSLFTYK